MIIYIDCPACGQKHGIYLSSHLLQGRPLKTVCPITHTLLYIRLQLTVEAKTTFTKEDLEVAEEEAEFEDRQWEIEEGVRRDMDGSEETPTM